MSSWCSDNFLNIRSLKQTQNIRSQLKSLFDKIDMKVCEKSLKNDHIYKMFKEEKAKYKDESQRYRPFLMALTAGK